MQKLKRFLIPLILVFLVVFTYANSLNNGFVSDDIPDIVKTGASWTWMSVFTSTYFLTRWTRILQFFLYQLVGLSPWAYRLANIMSHAVSVLLVYQIVFFIFQRFFQSRDAGPHRATRVAFLASSLFAVHPMIVESVTWISGGVYAQYGMMFLLSFWLYIKGEKRHVIREKQDKKDDTYYFSPIMYYVSLLTYVFSLFLSEKASVLFLFFFLYEWCFGNLKKNWRKLIPFFVVSCIFILFYVTQLQSRIASVSPVSGGGEGGIYNPLIQLPIALFSYFQLIVWPQNLTFYHSDSVISVGNYVLRAIVVCCYAFSIAITAIKNKKLCFWLLWFFIPLFPTLTPFKIAWLVAERYAYLSVIGIFVLIAYWFESFFQYAGPATSVSRKHPHERGNAVVYPFSRMAVAKIKPMLLTIVRYCGRLQDTFARVTRTPWLFIFFWMIIVSALIARTIIRNRDWQNEDTLWIATAQTSPLIPFTWNNMGDVYSRHGDLQKAAESFQRAIALNPQYADAYHNLGETYQDMGEIGDAILMYEKALSLNPNLWQSHQSLAAIYYDKKDYQNALSHIGDALKIMPDNVMLLRARDILQKTIK